MTALPTAFLAGHEISADEYQPILDLLNLGGLFYGVQTTTQSTSSALWTSINMDGTETVDLENAHSTVTNPSRYVCQTTAGYYVVSGVVAFAANATGGRGAAVAKNGTRVAGSTNYVQSVATAATPTVVGTAVVVVRLAVNDYVEIMGIQNSGGSLSTIVQSDNTSSMTVMRRVSTST